MAMRLNKFTFRIEPDYQELSNSNIPKAEESMGSQAPVYTIPPTTFFGFTIDPGAQFYQDQELQKSRIAFAHVLESGKGGAVFVSSESSSCFSTHCCVRTRDTVVLACAWNKSFRRN
ncbi:hypothetical protein Bca4012_007820 [Brassica carinata]